MTLHSHPLSLSAVELLPRPWAPPVIPRLLSLPGSAVLFWATEGVGGWGWGEGDACKAQPPPPFRRGETHCPSGGELGSPRGRALGLWCPRDCTCPPFPSLPLPFLLRVLQGSPPCSVALRVLAGNRSLQMPPLILTRTVLLQVPSDK